MKEPFLIIKTAQSEFRCWEHLSEDVRTKIIPVVELTRGRKIPKSGKGLDDSALRYEKGIYNFEGNVTRVAQLFRTQHALIDLTQDDRLMCSEIDDLLDPREGYHQWVSFFFDLKEQNEFLCPILQVNNVRGWSQDEYVSALSSQFLSFASRCQAMGYRLYSISDPEAIYDIAAIANLINEFVEKGGIFYVILDAEFINKGAGPILANHNLQMIRLITDAAPNVQLGIVGTSFPNNVAAYGGENHDTFPIEEIYLFDTILRGTNVPEQIRYGDYGSINPVRNDIVYATSWRPRIDYSTGTEVFYYREKKAESYENHYQSVAKKVVSDNRFEELEASWGCRQIRNAANGRVGGKAPSFWISVRMEIHIRQNLRRLGLL